MSAITISDLNNGKRDVDHLAAIATSPELTAVDRLGRVKPTVEGVTRALANKLADVEAVRVDAVGKIGADVDDIHAKRSVAVVQIDGAVSNVEGVVVAAVEAAVAATATSAGIATATLAHIRNLYYGWFDAGPTTRPDGSPRQAGDRYFDIVQGAEKTFNGSIWYVPNVDASVLAQPGGSAGVGFLQAGIDAAPRDMQQKAREAPVTPDDHFLAGESDWTGAVQRAIRNCEDNKREFHYPRPYLVSDEITVRKQILMSGCGSGAGYGEDTLTAYRQISGLRVTGIGQRRWRTRQMFRSSASDPQDAPLSCALNVQAENCVFRDFTVSLDFDPSDPSPKNYGADWDCGIFVGTRVHQSFSNVHVVGYWREACFWFDVTRQTNLPQFSDPDGVPFEAGTVQNGGDGCTMYKCYARGGKWGVRVAGSQPAPGHDLPDVPYYDELSGTTQTDGRGIFGFSDFTVIACSIYGTDHHSNCRRDDPTGNYLTDTAGGAMWISGMNGAGRIQGMRFYSTRFATFEPYRIRLGRCNRVYFNGCHTETRSGSRRKSSTGGDLVFNSTDTYGLVSMEANSRNIGFEFHGGTLTASGFDAFIDPAATYHELYGSTSGNISTTYHTMVAAGFRSLKGELDLRSATATDPVRIRAGGGTLSLFEQNGLRFGSGTINAAVITDVGNLDLRSGVGGYVSLRQGNVSTARINSTVAEFIPPITAPLFKARNSTLILETASVGASVSLRDGASTEYLSVGTDGILLGPGMTSSSGMRTSVGNLDLRSASGAYVGLRAGSVTTAQIGETVALFSASEAIRSTRDNVTSAGAPSFRYSQVYAGNNAINTSDANYKVVRPGGLSAAEMRAWSRVSPEIFQWKDAIAVKGAPTARLNAGYIAQKVKAAFEAEGLDVSRYALWCSDDVMETVTKERTETRTETHIERISKHRTERRPKTAIVEVEEDYVEVVDGKGILKRRTVMRETVVTITVPLLDESGVALLDEDGEPMLHTYVDEEDVEVEYFEEARHTVEVPYTEEYDEEVPTGEVRLGLRYEQCLVFECAYLRSLISSA